METLEPRTLLSVYAVTTVADSGSGSLRQAILAANASPGPDTIQFGITGSSAHKISLLSALPAITDATTVDGASQPGYADAPLIWLDGSGITNSGAGLTVAAANSTIRGLAITGFNQDGILIQGSNDSVTDNFIGVDPTGALGIGNDANGIRVSGVSAASPASVDIDGNVISDNAGDGILFQQNFAASTVTTNIIGLDTTGSVGLGNGADGVHVGPNVAGQGVTLRGNVISANAGDGVCLDGAVNAVVASNLIGVDAAGALGIGNHANGLRVSSVSAAFPASADIDGNVISANAGAGILFQQNFAASTVTNNMIGLDATGSAGLGNGTDGVHVGPGVAGQGVTLRGNVISDNDSDGVCLDGAVNAVIAGNLIGLDASGASAVGNGGHGVDVIGFASNNMIGGATAADGNVISGNSGHGLRIAADANTVQGNLLGTTASGTAALPNHSDGVWIDGSRNAIGGTSPGQGNVIAFNVGNGVTVNSGAGNSIRGNSIFGNSSGTPTVPGIGIDLGHDGVTPNDSEGHTGANLFQNFPVLTSARRQGSALNVGGSLTAAPSGTFTIDFYANASRDPSGYGQGHTFLGSLVVATDSSGLATFTTTLQGVPLDQNVLTATATDSNGNTSEFNADRTVTTSATTAATTTTLTTSASPTVYGQSVTFTAVVANAPQWGVATGAINFMDGGVLMGTGMLDSSGRATWTTTSLGARTHHITAAYAGDGNFDPSTSNQVDQVVTPAVVTVATTTTLTTSASPKVYGQSVTFTAVVANAPQSGVATGAVNFMDGGVLVGTGTLDSFGHATWTTTSLGARTHHITAAYAGNGNFDPSTSNQVDQVVTPAVLTVTASNAAKTYGAANPSFTAAFSGFVNGDTSSVITGAASLTTSATAASAVGTYPIAAAAGTLAASNYSFTCVNGTLTVSKAVLTVTASNAAKTYGAANPSLSSTITGFVNGQTSSVVTGAASLTTSATAASAAGTYPITAAAGTLAASNYSFTCVNGTLTVSKAVLTVTASNAAKTYGAANPSFTAAFSGFVNGDTSSVVTGAAGLTTSATAASAAGTYAITAAQGTLAASNYSFTCVNGTLTVSKAVLTVTANNAAKACGAANPSFTAAFSGFVNGDTSSVITGAASLTTSATAASAAGTYPITAAAGTLAASNYSFTCVNGTLTVSKAVLTVTASNAARAYGAANPSLSSTITGFVNGDTSSVVTGAAGLTTSATAASAAGTYAITAAQGTLAASNYSFTFVNGTLTVSKAVLTVTANNAAKTYGAANPSFTAAFSGFVNGDTSSVITGAASLTTSATAASAAGTYAITAAQGTLAASNYSFTCVNGTLTVNKAVLTVTANNAAKTYGAANPSFTAAFSGFVNGDTSSVVTGAAGLTTSATAASAVGTYPIAAAAGTLAASNYSFTFVNGTLTVSKAVLTVTANNAAKTYGAANPSFTAAFSGFVNGDASSVVSGSAGLTTTATTSSPAGTYAITAAQGTLAASNYSFTCVNGTLTVSKAVLTVTASNAAKTYGAANPSLSSTITGFVNGDTSSVVTGAAGLTTSATAASAAGTYAITAAQGTLAASNYSFTCVNGTLTVNKAVLTVTANPAVKAQGTANPAFSATIAGYVNGDASSVVSGSAGLTTTATTSSPAGTYAITAAQGTLAASNYTFTCVSGTLTVNPNPSTLSGYVYYDKDNDGVKDSSETGISSVQVTLSGSNDLGAIASTTVQTDANGYYSFPSLRPGTYTIAETSPATYTDGKDTLGNQGGTVGSDQFTNIVIAGGVTGSGYNFGELQNLVSGHAYKDISGNGLSGDDVALPGVSVQLFLERNGNSTRDSGDGSPVATAVTDANGAYAFANVASGHYYVNEVVPNGYVRTIPYFADYCPVDLTTTRGGTSFDFDNYLLDTGTITNVSFKINGTTTVTDLRDNTNMGNTVKVTFTVVSQPATVTLVVYDAPSANYDANTASQQTIHTQVGNTYSPGTYSLTVTLPNNYYQIDFIQGLAIYPFGPSGSNIFYSSQSRLISADND